MNNTQTLVLTLPILKTFRLGLNLKIFWIFIVFLIFSLLVVCIFQLNAYTREFYLIQEYERNLGQLTQENKMLEINFSQANSLRNMGNYAQIFEKAERVEYIRVLESTVLAK